MSDLKRKIETNTSNPFAFYIFCIVCYLLFVKNHSPWIKWPFIIVAILGFVSQMIQFQWELASDEEPEFPDCEVKDKHS